MIHPFDNLQRKMHSFAAGVSLVLLVLLLGSQSSREGPENGHCPENGCPDELEIAGDSSAQHWTLFSAIRDTLTSVKDTLKYNAYRAAEGAYNKTVEFAEGVYETIDSFAERVRDVFREEFSSFLDVLWEGAMGTTDSKKALVIEKLINNVCIFADSLFLKFKKVVVNRVLALGLIILCIIIDLFIWNLSYSIISAISWILLVNSAVAVGYKLLGPLWVYWAFGMIVWYTWYVLSCIWSYPYTSAGVICVLFVINALYSIYRWRANVERMNWEQDTILSINRRLCSIEQQQTEIVRQNNELKQLMQELLRHTSSQNSM